MNKSGSSIQSLVNFYKLEKEDILVIHDDIDHAFGKIKLKYGGSHGGHNGIRDTIDHLGSQKFRRLKLGVGRPSGKMDVSDYVLGKMKDDEMKHWADHLPDVFAQVEQWLKNVG
jgi:PTH1 family peptidyl-tRNA hydrolase